MQLSGTLTRRAKAQARLWLERRGWYLQRLGPAFPRGVNLWHDLRRQGFRDDPATVVFDVGANVGNWTQELLQHFPNVTVHAFEPVPATYHALNKTLGHLGNVYTHQVALAESSESATMFVYASSELNSLNQITESDWHANDKIAVRTLKLDTFCNNEGIQKIDLIKLDIEGSEINALAGGSLTLKFTQRIFSEFGMYSERHTQLTQLLEYLESHGFFASCFFNEHVWPTGVFGKGSVLFVRGPLS